MTSDWTWAASSWAMGQRIRGRGGGSGAAGYPGICRPPWAPASWTDRPAAPILGTMPRPGATGTVDSRSSVRLAASVLAAGLLAAIGACGGSGDSPPGSANGAAAGFLDDIEAGRFAAACARVAPDVAADIRLSALANLHVPAGTRRARISFIRRANARARRCPGAMALRTSQVQAVLPRLRSATTAAEVSMLSAADAVIDAKRQLWVLHRGNRRWTITEADAFISGECGPPC